METADAHNATLTGKVEVRTYSAPVLMTLNGIQKGVHERVIKESDHLAALAAAREEGRREMKEEVVRVVQAYLDDVLGSWAEAVCRPMRDDIATLPTGEKEAGQ